MEQPRNVIGAKIRKLRDAKKISQLRLSTLCAQHGFELSRGTLAKIESQIRTVRDVEIFVLASALGVKIEQLFPDNFSSQLRAGKIAAVHTRRT